LGVLDFRGIIFIDKNNIDIFKKSDLIIIPTLLDVNSIKRSVNTFKELNRLNSNIVFIVNQFNKKRSEKFAQSIQILEALADVYLINESEIVINSIHTNKTIKEQIESNPLFMHSAKTLYTQYTSLLKLAKGGN
jgi:methionine synthase I (cobalamin-dependent)